MSESGEWGLLIQGVPPQQQGQPNRGRPNTPATQQQRRGGAQPGSAADRDGGAAAQSTTNPTWQANIQRAQRQAPIVAVPPGGKNGRGRGRGRTVTTGPIVGVYSATGETAAKSFAGAESYDQWHFVVSLIPQPAMVPGEGRILRSRNDWIGRPFREGLQPVVGTGPAGAAGRQLTPAGGPSRQPGGAAAGRRGAGVQRRRR
jgi:hypothetical protein